MDVVRSNIERIGGTVELASTLGTGTCFTIKIPLTLAIVSALIVRSCGERFAIPQISVLELVRVGGGPAQVLYAGKTTAMRGELVEDGAVVADLYHRCAAGYGAGRAQRMMGLKFRDAGMPSLEQFRQAVDENKLVAIRFTAA